MNLETPLRVSEFTRHMESLERSINNRFDSVDDNLQKIRDSQGQHAERIAVLEADKQEGRKKQLSLAGVFSLIGVGIVEALKRLFG